MCNPFAVRLQELLNTCFTSEEDLQKSEDAVSSLVEFIDYIHDTILLDENPEELDEASKQNAMEILTELLQFVSSASLGQTVIDALLFELPKSVVKFAGVSNKCCEIAECVIHRLIDTCNPRDMLTVICEVLDSPNEICKEPAYYIPLFSGISKVFAHLQRRHFENIKEALPAVLNVLQAVFSKLDDENKESFKDLIVRGIDIATSIQEVCQKLESRQKEQIRALLGLFVLQITALASSTLSYRNLNIPTMTQLSRFLSFCNLSYLGLVTGGDVEASKVIIGEESDDYMSCFSLVEQGAFVTVVWGFVYDEVAMAVNEDLAVVKNTLQNSRAERWQTVGMSKYFLSSIDQPWKLKEHAIDFLLCIMEKKISPKYSNANCQIYVASLYSAVQAIEMVMIYAPDAILRKKAFATLKIVLADISTPERFDILRASITNSNYPSMIAILLDIVREEIRMEISQKGLRHDEVVLEGNNVSPSSPFRSTAVLELVGLVLKPPQGGHPSLPEQSDAVLSALNLYRFLLLTESTGKTNYTGVLSQNTLQKAYVEWLLPLRALLSEIVAVAENEKECSQFADDNICALNPLQLVLYRCIELVEDNLQRTA